MTTILNEQESRTETIRVRLSKSEVVQWNRVAALHNLSVSSLLRMLVHHNDETGAQSQGRQSVTIPKLADKRSRKSA